MTAAFFAIGFKHARAIRLVAKELLKDVWRESRDFYNPPQ